MYFYLGNGKQHMNLQGDLILTQNKNEVMARVKSAAPTVITRAGGRVFTSVRERPFWQKVKIVFVVIGFLWGKDERLTPDA